MARKSSKPKSKKPHTPKEFATPEGIKNIIKNFNVQKGND